MTASTRVTGLAGYVRDQATPTSAYVGGLARARVLIDVDYPHSDSNWPNSRKRIAENLIEVNDHDVHRIVKINARELLHFGDSR